MREAAQLIAAGNEVMIEKKRLLSEESNPPEWKNEQGRKRHPKKKLQ